MKVMPNETDGDFLLVKRRMVDFRNTMRPSPLTHIQDNVLHELCLDELQLLPSHLHQLCQCHRLEAISGIYPDILIPHFLALGRISTHATHSHSRYELREIRHLQMAVIQIVHQEIGISSNLVALIIETTFHHHLTLDIAGWIQWQRAITSPVAILIPLWIASYIP